MVPTVGLGDLLERYDPTKLKFDIENSEYEVFPSSMEALRESRVTRVMGELHTRNQNTLKLAKELWHLFDRDGWQTPRHVDSYYEKPNGWNIITYWYR